MSSLIPYTFILFWDGPDATIRVQQFVRHLESDEIAKGFALGRLDVVLRGVDTATKENTFIRIERQNLGEDWNQAAFEQLDLDHFVGQWDVTDLGEGWAVSWHSPDSTPDSSEPQL